MFLFYALLLFAVAVGPTSAWASTPLEERPGYIDFSALGLFDGPEPEANMEIYLKKPLLEVMAAATHFEDEELANMLEALELICVRAYQKEEDAAHDYERVAARLKALTLPDDWERVVQVRENDERMQFYVRPADEAIVGLLVLADSPGELVFINLVGSLDLAQVGRIGRKFNIAPLDSMNFKAPEED